MDGNEDRHGVEPRAILYGFERVMVNTQISRDKSQ